MLPVATAASRSSSERVGSDSKTEAERSARFLARHDGVGGESYQTRTKERVYAEIAALKEERAARARRARERWGW